MTDLQTKVDQMLVKRGFTVRNGKAAAVSQTGERYREQIIDAPLGEIADKIVEAIEAHAAKVNARTIYWRIRPDLDISPRKGSRAYMRYLISDKPPKQEAA